MDAMESRSSERRYLRLRDVMRLVPLCRSRIYELAAEGRFPQPIKLSERASAWDAREIDEWLRERVAASRRQVSARPAGG